MERRSFLKTLAAALAATQAPAVYGGDGRPAGPAHYGGDGRPVGPVSNAHPAVTPNLSGMFVRSVSVVHEGGQTFWARDLFPAPSYHDCRIEVEAYFDNETAPLLIDACRSREAVELSLPIFKHVGIADQLWVVERYSIFASADDLIQVTFTMRTADGAMKVVAPVDVPGLVHMKVAPRS